MQKFRIRALWTENGQDHGIEETIEAEHQEEAIAKLLEHLCEVDLTYDPAKTNLQKIEVL